MSSVIRAALVTSARSVVGPSSRTLHVSAIAHKSATEKVSQVADQVNKTVGKGLADAIDKGEKATQAAKETLGATKDKIAEQSSVAGQKANQAAAGARQGTRDLKQAVEKEARK